MDKVKMKSMDIVGNNIEKIGQLFPNCITEVKNDNGKIEHAIDFDKLKQELSRNLVEGKKERYEFTWPDKRQAIVTANAPVPNTLRPLREKSVDFDNTQNVYIEGDNLVALKLLQETYLGKIKMIYIDPPYNTGNDFVYEDDFSQNAEDYMKLTGDADEQGNRLTANKDSNGRFHTDWLNMMYPRLKLAKDLLTEDGAIFISIDDNEQSNVVRMCYEIFGESNKIAEFIVIRSEGGGLAKQVIKGHDYLFVFAKDSKSFFPLGRPKDIRGKIIEKNGDKYWIQEDWLRKEFGKYGNCHYEEILTYKGSETLKEIDLGIKNGDYVLIPKENGMHIVGKLRNVNEDYSKFYSILKHLSANGVRDLNELGLDSFFSYPKPVSLLQEIVRGKTLFSAHSDDVILDFFSGSATTAHAVMKLNAEDGGNRKFIMVQLPEVCDDKSEAKKAGYNTICDIGEERIRRAGKKIKEEVGLLANDLDVGFRVFKIDESNMKNVYYKPEDIQQGLLPSIENNIKEDRTPEDLLFQVMIDEFGIPLSAKIEKFVVEGKTIFNVDDAHLVACFDTGVTDEVVTAIAKLEPNYAAFRDSSYANDSVATNFEQIFNKYSPNTIKKVL